jgi:hypothetical protein
MTKFIEGGSNSDYLRGGATGLSILGKEGDEKVIGGASNDILSGGPGNDVIIGSNGDDSIYGGNRMDVIDAGPGSDTMIFKGDGIRQQGVNIDLKFGFGEKSDAERDRYKGVENVFATIYNDRLTGSNANNRLYGAEGNDTFIAFGGTDCLTGGEGTDLYLLDQAFGMKVINNYGEDRAKDTLSLLQFNSTDACIFLIGNDLILQFSKDDLASIFHGQTLTILFVNWIKHSKYRHLKIVYQDKVYKLTKKKAKRHKFKLFTESAHLFANHVDLKAMSARGSAGTHLTLWKKTNDSIRFRLDSALDLFVVNFDVKNTKHLNETKLSSRNNTAFVPTTSDADMVFALVLKYCSATVAVSQTIMSYGRERSCPASQIGHSNVQSTSTKVHGENAAVICESGFHLSNQNNGSCTCLDGEWVPPIPLCVMTKKCPFPEKPVNGLVSSTGLEEGSKAYYVCHKRYILSGMKERKCVNQSWEGSVPNCLERHCTKLPMRKNGQYVTFPFYKQRCAYLSCDQNFLPSVSFVKNAPRFGSILFCIDGRWEGSFATCEAKTKLATVRSTPFKTTGRFQRWINGEWKHSGPTTSEQSQVCSRNGMVFAHRQTNLITCSRLRMAESRITDFEENIEVLDRGRWKTVCVKSMGSGLCDLMGMVMTGESASVIQIASSTWTDLELNCSAGSSIRYHSP